MVEIPHIELFHELHAAISPVLSTIEPIHAYLYTLSSKAFKKDFLKPSGFFFLLDNNFDSSTHLHIIIDLYKDVTCTLLLLSEIERVKEDFSCYLSLKALLLTTFALKANIQDISPLIKKIKTSDANIHSKQVCKTLFLYTESVRALLEELLTLKSILLEEVMSFKQIALTKEPLDLKGDLE